MGNDLGCVVRVHADGEVRGSGFLIAPEWVLTCKHVVVEREGRTGTLTDVACRDLRVDTCDGLPVCAKRSPYLAPSWDLALLELEAALPVSPLPLLWGLTESQEPHLRHAPIWVYGYPEVESTKLWQHPIRDLFRQPSARAHTQILTQLQLTGGIPQGCSGGPALLRWGEQLVYVGTVYLGGEKSPTSRLIMADPVAEFLHEAGLHEFPRLDAPRALALVPADTREAEQLIERPGIQETRPNPYRGLHSFRELDAPYFFGREDDCQRLWATVREQPFVALVGASGGGKSSLLFAGLVPLVRQEGDWQLAVFRPGLDPFDGVATALTPLLYPELEKQERRERHNQLRGRLGDGRLDIADGVAIWAEEHPEQRLVLIADQFEELYTQNLPEARQRRFLDSLMTLTQRAIPCTLLVSLRADFLSQALTPGALSEAVKEYRPILLGSMSEAQLRTVIEGPAAQLGVSLAPGLTQRILDELGREPGTLPLLEFALTELWQRQSEASLTHKAYDAIGGVGQALAHYADGEVARLGVSEEELRRVFVQLVRPGEGTEDTRQVATREQVGEAQWPLITRLADARLVVTGTPEPEVLEEQGRASAEIVEIVHEALIRHWQPLGRWLEADRKFRLWQNHLRQELEVWEQQERDEGALLRGARLAEAQEQLAARSEELSPKERAYIEASTSVHERAWRTERRRHKLVRLTAGVMTVLSLVAVVAGFIAFERGTQAKKARLEAEQQSQVARSRENQAIAGQLAAQAPLVMDNTGNGLQLSALLAIESLKREQTLFGYLAWERAMDLMPRRRPMQLKHEGEVWAVAISPDGTRIATAGEDGTARLWDASGGVKLAPLVYEDEDWRIVVSPDGQRNGVLPKELFRLNHRDVVTDVAFSPDGRRLATVSNDESARVWDAVTGQELLRVQALAQRGYDERVWLVRFSPDGQRLATAGADKSARVWNVATGQELFRTTHEDPVWHLVFSPDGRYLVTASDGDILRVWDSINGKQVSQLAHQDTVFGVTFSPNSQHVASVTESSLQIWDVETEKETLHLTHRGGSNQVAFSYDGRRLVMTGGADNAIHIWDVSDGRKLFELGYEGYVWRFSYAPATALTPNESRFATASADTAKLWDDAEGRELARLVHHQCALRSVVVSAGGHRLVTRCYNGTAWLWDTATGPEVARMKAKRGNGPPYSVSLDGQRLAITDRDSGTVRVWDTATARELSRVHHDGPVSRVLLGPKGKRLATFKGEEIGVWDTASGKNHSHFSHHGKLQAYQAVFSPDGGVLATNSYEEKSDDNVTRLWNTDTAQELARLPQKGQSPRMAFSADSGHFASESRGTVLVWDINNRREVMRIDLDRREHSGTDTKPDRPESKTLYSFGFGNREMDFNPDGSRLAATIGDDLVRVWDLTSGRELARLSHEHAVKRLLVDAEAGRLATASGRKVRIWDSANGKEVYRLNTKGRVDQANFSPGGRYLASQSEDLVQVWDPATGKEVARLVHEGAHHLMFTPDEEYLATVGSAETVRIWKLATGREIARIRLDRNSTERLFTADGRRLVTALSYQPGFLLVWLWRRDDLVAEACRRLTRNLTREEWRQYLGDEQYRQTCPDLPPSPE